MGKTVTVNFKKVTDYEEPVDKGDYPVTITKFIHKPGDERNPKSDYDAYVVVAEITDGPFAGRKLSQFLDTNPEENGQGFVQNTFLYLFLKALRMATSPTEISFDPDEIPGHQMVWSVDINSQNKNIVRKYQLA